MLWFLARLRNRKPYLSLQPSLSIEACQLHQVMWIEGLLKDLSITVELPIALHYDNKVVQHIAPHLVYHERTKRLSIDCHYIRERIVEGLIKTSYVQSSAQIADVLTKPLGEVQ